MRQPGRHPDPGQEVALGIGQMAERERETRVAAALRQRGPHEGWHNVGDPGEPAFVSPWVNVDTIRNPLGFFKDSAGFVHLRGLITTNSAPSGSFAVFTLPDGYTPPFQETQAARVQFSGGAIDIVSLVIRTSGDVELPIASYIGAQIDNHHFYVG